MEISDMEEAIEVGILKFLDKITIEEWEWLKDEEKCPNCGHLEIFHSGPCSDFCHVTGCKCEEEE